VPLQRPQQFGARNLLTDDEFQARIKQAKQTDEDALADFDVTTADTGNAGAVGSATSPPPHWLERGKPSRQASLIVDPPDGRQPAQVPEAQKRAAEAQAARKGRGPADSYTDRSNYDRCISLGTLNSVTPKIYNSGSRIVQGPGWLAFTNEMIHETRVIPTDGRTNVNGAISSWMGNSVGRWEGDTLVVTTRNLKPESAINGQPLSPEGVITERFTLKSPDVIWYEVTIEDPNVFTRPWTIAMPIYRRAEPNMQLLEFRCNEFVEEFMYGSLRKEQLVRRWDGEMMSVEITRKVPEGDRFYEWYSK
jgi:hypothetical protein